MPSRTLPTIRALHALWSAASAVTDLADVWFGPELTGEHGAALWVGYDGDPGGEFQAVIQDSAWAGLGAKARDEEFVVRCAATVLIGDDDVDAAVALAEQIVGAAETALRGDPSLGQTPPPFQAAITAQQLFIEPTPPGTQVRVPFDVGVKTRI